MSLYKFVYGKKSEWNTTRGKVFLITSLQDGSKYSLRADEFELASLFDGMRSKEDVMAAFKDEKGLPLVKKDLDVFIEKLADARLLQDKEATPVRMAEAANVADFKTRANASIGMRNDPAYASNAAPVAASEAEAVHWMDEPIDNEVLYASGSSDGDAADIRQPVASSAPGATPTSMLRLPVRWLLPLGRLFILPMRSKLMLGLVVAGALLCAFGLIVNRLEMVQDLHRLLEPLILVQTLLIGMFSINLLGQVTRCAAVQHYTGEIPRFGITLRFILIPRFFADLSVQRRLLSVPQRRKILAGTLYFNIFLFAVTAFLWIIGKDSGLYISLLFLGISVITAIRFLLSVNPLAKRNGYYLLATGIGVPDLRERAFLSLVSNTKKPPPYAGARSPSLASLRVYALASIAYLFALTGLIVWLVGTWLEANWGGLGVIIFLALFVMFFYPPWQRARAGLQQRRDASASMGLPVRKSKNKARSYVTTAVVLVAVAVLMMLPYTYEPGGEFTVLPGKRSDVRALITGEIKDIFVTDGEFVKKGQLLARVSADEEFKNIATTNAKLAELNAGLQKAINGATREEVAVARQKVSTARTNVNFSRTKAERHKELHGKGAVSTQDYENALADADRNQELFEQAQKDLQLVLAGVRQEEINAIKAEVAEQQALLKYYQQQSSYSDVKAPMSGHIVSGSLLYDVGNYLKRGDLFATIEFSTTALAEIKVPQADVSEVDIGAPVRLKTWAYPDREFSGTVKHIAPTAEEAPYGKVVRVVSEIDNSDGLLKTELTGHAKIRGEEKPVIVAYTRMLMRFFSIELWSWVP